MTGLLAITAEPLGARMAGPAIRALELCRAAGHAGITSTLMSLSTCAITDPIVNLIAADPAMSHELVSAAGSVLLQGDVLNMLPWLSGCDVPIVVDAYDPFHFEQLEQARPLGEARRRVIVRDCIATLNRQLTRADLVLAASDRQRDLWLGQLAALGRVNPVTYDADPHLGGLLRVVPFGVPDGRAQPPTAPVMRGILPGIDDDSVIALWAGGLYDWFDPLLVLDAVAAAVGRNPRLRLVFLGTSHPVLGQPTDSELAVRRRADELGLSGSVVHLVDRWVPYDERAGWLAEADLAVIAHRPGLETEFAFRTRVLDHLWAGLPTIGTRGDVLVNRISAAGGGLAVEPGDRDGFTDALVALADSSADRERAATVALGIAEEYRWTTAAEPLIQFCRRPARAPDLVLPLGQQALLGLTKRSFRPGPVDRIRAGIAEGGVGLVVRRLLHRVGGR